MVDSEMLCAIMQPTYLPWLGYFDLLDRVDRFVLLDDAKVSKQTWGVRNRILTAQGECFLTVPLKGYIDHKRRSFANTAVDYSKDWAGKQLKTISQAYGKAACFPEVFPDLESLLSVNYATIGELNIRIIEHFTSRLGIKTEIVRSSALGDMPGQKDERLAAICRVIGASDYIAPQGSAVYIEKERPGGAFTQAGIGLWYHHFTHPEYPQRGSGFLSHMAIIDLLMNCGYDAALEIIRSGRRGMIGFMEFRKTCAYDS